MQVATQGLVSGAFERRMPLGKTPLNQRLKRFLQRQLHEGEETSGRGIFCGAAFGDPIKTLG
jgi:hypothetical protein